MPKYKITIEGGEYEKPITFEFDQVHITVERALEPHRKRGSMKLDRYEPKGKRLSLRAWEGGENNWVMCAGMLPEVVEP